MNVLWALIRKDWRVVKPVILVGVLSMLAPSLIQTGVNAWRTYVKGNPSSFAWPHEAAMEEQREWFQGAVMIGFVVWCAVCPAIGGVMFARERRDRSAELIELLPVTRRMRLFSKVILLVVTLSVAVLITTRLFHLATWIWPSTTPYISNNLWDSLRPLIGMMVVMSGVSWMLSSLLRSEVIATTVTFGGVCLAAMLMGMVPGPHGTPNWYEWLDSWTPAPGVELPIVLAFVGVVAFVTGCVVTLRRREV